MWITRQLLRHPLISPEFLSLLAETWPPNACLSVLGIHPPSVCRSWRNRWGSVPVDDPPPQKMAPHPFLPHCSFHAWIMWDDDFFNCVSTYERSLDFFPVLMPSDPECVRNKMSLSKGAVSFNPWKLRVSHKSVGLEMPLTPVKHVSRKAEVIGNEFRNSSTA